MSRPSQLLRSGGVVSWQHLARGERHAVKILDRKLGVVVRGARIPVAEHVGDRLERVTLSEKVDGERMADDAGAAVARFDTCLLQVATDEVAHDASPAKCPMRRIATEEHL